MSTPALHRRLQTIDVADLPDSLRAAFAAIDYHRATLRRCWLIASGIPGARFQEIRGCGHCPQIEDPAAFVNAVESFLS